jgi:hypothetical protein
MLKLFLHAITPFPLRFAYVREPKQQFEPPPLGKVASKAWQVVADPVEVGMRHSSPTAKIRYAVVGLGHIAQVAVLLAFKHASNCKLLALVSGDAKRDPFAAELVYFSDCILKDKDPEPSGTEGLLDVRMVQTV